MTKPEAVMQELDPEKLLMGALELAYFGGRGSTRKAIALPDFSADAKRINQAIGAIAEQRERERCAQVADYFKPPPDRIYFAPFDIAQAIRQGETT